MSLEALASGLNVIEPLAEEIARRLDESGDAVELRKPRSYVSKGRYDEAYAKAAAYIEERHAAAPWRLGCSPGEIAGVVRVDSAVMGQLLASWHDDGRLASWGNYWHAPSFVPALTKEQCAFIEREFSASSRPRAEPVSYPDVSRKADAERVAGFRDALEAQIVIGALYRVGDDLYTRDQMDAARACVAGAIAQNEAGATMSQLREALGLSRKYALPLMEYFDSVGFTMRQGDVRRLRAAGKIDTRANAIVS